MKTSHWGAKTLRWVYLVACISTMLSRTAYAYLDPSVMTFTVQAIAGAAIAIGAIAAILWRKFKKKVGKTLNVEKRAKEMESDEIDRVRK